LGAIRLFDSRQASRPGHRPSNSHADCASNRHAITISVYDRGMPASVNVPTVHPRTVAAVRREVAPGAVGSEWEPAPGQGLGVQFAASQACGLMGTTSFSTITRHSRERQYCATSGVEVTHKFDTAGEVCATEAKRPGCRCHPTRSIQSHEQGRRRNGLPESAVPCSSRHLT
jgi:hypothetical protein